MPKSQPTSFYSRIIEAISRAEGADRISARQAFGIANAIVR